MFRKLRRFLAYITVAGLVRLAEILPRRVGTALFAWLGAVAYGLMARSRGVALANLELVYGSTTPDTDKRRIARAAFINLGRFAYDTARMRKTTPQTIQRITGITGKEHLDGALARGKGVVALTGHVGNWELMGAYFSLMGYPLTVFATDLKDSRLNDLLADLRTSTGLKVVERSKGLPAALRCLKRGEMLGALIDQDTSVDSVVVDFLGSPAKTPVGPTKLASRMGAPVVPMAMLMTDDGDYRIEVKEPVTVGDNGSSLEDDVEKCSKAIEEFIHRKPSQWVWMHKRWKSVLSDMYS
ncbi:MAG: lysophospholipid acyltransferase family protein [Candidatus Eisenbacteria bacterium]